MPFSGGSSELTMKVESDTVQSQEVSRALDALSKGKLEKASEYLSEALMTRFNSSTLQTLNAIAYHMRALDGESAMFELAEQG